MKGSEAPDLNDEYFLYQTLIGAYPVDGEQDESFLSRLKAYLIKAVREAKVHTEWLKPDAAYEQAFVNFAEAILAPGDDNRFRAFDARTGKEVWTEMIEAGAHAAPITYQGKDGKQYVVIAAGGHVFSKKQGDAIIAYAL